MWPFKEKFDIEITFSKATGNFKVGTISVTKPKDPGFADMLGTFIVNVLQHKKDGFSIAVSEPVASGRKIEVMATCHFDMADLDDMEADIADYFTAFQNTLHELLADGGKKFKSEFL